MIILCFFQAEDGIRDGHVTGVQTCALPILISDANMAIIIITNMTTPNVYIGYLNTRKSNTGSSSFSWRNEIGRASCRERVSIRGHDRSVNTTDEREHQQVCEDNRQESRKVL